MTLAEAEVHILTILKQIMEEKLTSVNIQVGSPWCGTHCAAGVLVRALSARKGAALVPLQVASVRSGGMQEQKCFTVYSKERLEEIIAQIKK